ncbi:hypothetical protein TNCV_3009121 [Trichonephila clavipes]|nr:hypothetical protein TNCV_3009121 [Trichonephila clavipes]
MNILHRPSCTIKRDAFRVLVEASVRKVSYGLLLFLMVGTRVKQDICSSWKQASVHERYEKNHPDAALLGTSSRRDETTLTKFCCGHIRAQR